MSENNDLKIRKLFFSGFRNYEHLEMDGLGDLTVLIGRNAIGKTNILEGIQLLTTGSSFRHAPIENLLLDGGEEAMLEINLEGMHRAMDVRLHLERGKKGFFINGKVKQASEVKGLLPAVVFTPDDLQIPKKTSSVKRDSLDYIGAQISRTYDAVLHDYRKVIRFKNKLLKDGCDANMLESINETLVMCGAQLYCFRTALFIRMIPLIERGYSQIAGERESFSASYVPSWEHLQDKTLLEMPGYLGTGTEKTRDEVRQALHDALDAHREGELERKTSLVGPHADKISFFIGGKDAAHFASQGQQRSIVLSWKVAEVQVVEQTLDKHPVLLLDDVMSELDPIRRERLVDFVKGDIQTFITATDLSLFDGDILKKAEVVELPLE